MSDSGKQASWPSARYRPAQGSIPEDPGVYRFLDPEGRPVYVGKAKNLRNRLSTYFQDPTRLHPRTQAMLEAAASVMWTVVASEVEALVLEQQWIHAYDPRFNVKMRDGKSYPSLAITTSDAVPRAMVWRGARKPGIRFFGPYPHGRDVAGTLDALLRAFPVRSCSKGFYDRHAREGRPCLLADIGKCAAPCVGRISREDHRDLVSELSRFLSGDTKSVIQRLESEMEEAAEALDFERAARRRDDLQALRGVIGRQRVVLEPSVDADVFAHHADELSCSWYVFFVRGGVVRGVRSWVTELDPAESFEDATTAFLTRAYAEIAREEGAPLPPLVLEEGAVAPPRRRERSRLEEQLRAASSAGPAAPRGGLELPAELLLDVELADPAPLEALLRSLAGRNVTVRTPQRGPKRELLDTVSRNAAQVLANVNLQRASDLTARTGALSELADALELERPPLRIECYDISHTQGSNAVGSMVVFEDAVARKDAYRQFNISPEAAGDDLASMREVLSRRFSTQRTGRSVDQLTGEVTEIADEQTRRAQLRFATPPDLLIVDGGAPQVAAAQTVLAELGLEIPLCGLAKRLEEVFLPDDPDPLILARSSEALYLMQRLRDEAHRFAITNHRKRRAKAMTASALDAVPGLGAKKRTQLLTKFGSAAGIMDATDEELLALPGVGPSLLAALRTALAPPAPAAPAAAPQGASAETDAVLTDAPDLPTGEHTPPG